MEYNDIKITRISLFIEEQIICPQIDPISAEPQDDGGDCVAIDPFDHYSLHNFDCDAPLGVICAEYRKYPK